MRLLRLPLVLGRLLFLLVIGLVAAVLGTVGALTQTGAGHALLARAFSDQSRLLIRGSISIGAIGGNFRSRLVLDSVVIRDTTGFPLASLARVEAEYGIANLLARRLVFSRVWLTRPRIHLVKHRDGRLNLEEVLRLGEGEPGGGPGPLIELRDLRIDDGILTIRTPWSPAGQLTTEAERDSALVAQRLVPGRRIEGGGPDGLVQIRTVEGLTVRMPRFRLSTPDGQPLLAVIDSLAGVLNDPLVDIRSLRGELTQARDTLWFDFADAALPGTRGVADGLVAWPEDTVLFNFEFDAERMALADLRFIAPDFPDWTGRGRVEAYSVSGLETEYLLTGFEAGGSSGRVTGTFTALTHKLRGLGFRGLDVMLRDVDFDVVRPWLDTIPFQGRLSGRLRADGYFDRMRVALDWSFVDTRVPEQPENRLALEGVVVLGGDEGIQFHGVQVPSADLDLPTMSLAAPAVILGGRMAASGTLEGPWKDVTFAGDLRHRHGDAPESQASGQVRLNTRRDIVSLEADLDLAPLSFEGMRRSFPELTAQGDVVGPVRLSGSLDRLWVEANLRGDIGHLLVDGYIGKVLPRWEADSLRVLFRGLDLATLMGEGPSTALAGQVMLHGAVDSAAAPEGRMDLHLGPSWVREWRVDTVHAQVRVQDSVVQVDSAFAAWVGGEAEARGTLGWARPRDGVLNVGIVARRLVAFDSILVQVAEVKPDSLLPRRRLDGELDALVTVRGALDSFDVEGEAELRDARFARFAVPLATGTFQWQGGAEPRLFLTAGIDSLQAGTLRFAGLALEAEGPADSLTWRGSGRGGEHVAAAAAGSFDRRASSRLAVDSFALDVLDHHWRLDAPFTAVLADSVIGISPVSLRTDDGGASITIEGDLPHTERGELDVRVAGLELRDLYALLQRDTAAARGLLSLDLRLTGTAERPEMRGTGTLTGPVFGEFRAPLGRIAMQYIQRRLDANVTFWRTGRSLMEVSTTLPLDLGWRGPRPNRQLPGQVAIRAVADSMDLAVVEAFTPNVRRVRGILTADVTVQGTWDSPRMGGTVRIIGGQAAVPNLGVTYTPIDGVVTLAGDSIVVDSLRVGGAGGRLDASGLVRLERLTSPVLDLAFQARGFTSLNIPDYLTLEMDGDFQLRGPVSRATLTGAGTARNSVLYFSDLLTKSIVNLEDPLYADLVDTAAIRRRGLGAAFQSRFLDSLTISDFRFRAAEGVWLRSSEANIQLEGQVVVQKVRRSYRLDGTFTALRGTYSLRPVSFVNRAFDVTRGVVRYFGTPDLNASLDIEARHTIRSGSGAGSARDVEVIAHIGGTLRVPRLTLSSSIRPPLSQSDIVSLLVLGQTVNTQVAGAGTSALNQQAMALLLSTVSSEIERVLVADAGVGIDLIEIRPGMPYTGTATGASLTRLTAGWQIGSRWWVSLNAGFCPDFQQFDHRNFGVSLDYRLDRSWSLQASAEPIQACLANTTSEKRYQFGGDLRWSREY